MEPYDAIAAYYDLEHADFDEDVELYRQLVREGPVLEVGVGTGRIARALAREGLSVVGIDTSQSMLDIARERLRNYPAVELRHTAARDLQIQTRFAAALFPLNVLWHITEVEAQVEALRNVGRHLDSAGLLVVDVSNPLTMAERGARGLMRQRFSRWADGRQVAGFSAAWDDEGEQRLSLSLWYDELATDGSVRRCSADLELRYLFRTELELVIHRAGLEPRHTYGSYDLEPFNADSPRIIIVGTPG